MRTTRHRRSTGHGHPLAAAVVTVPKYDARHDLASRVQVAPQLAPLNDLIRNYHMEQMKLRYVADEVWHTNWKCLIENFMEAYHLSPLHKTTLHQVNPTKLCTHFEAGEAYFGYNAGYSPDFPRSTRGHPDLSDSEVGNLIRT